MIFKHANQNNSEIVLYEKVFFHKFETKLMLKIKMKTALQIFSVKITAVLSLHREAAFAICTGFFNALNKKDGSCMN